VWTSAQLQEAVLDIGMLETEEEVRMLCAVLVQKGFVDCVYDETEFQTNKSILAKQCAVG
jgi:hypothetical protein